MRVGSVVLHQFSSLLPLRRSFWANPGLTRVLARSGDLVLPVEGQRKSRCALDWKRFQPGSRLETFLLRGKQTMSKACLQNRPRLLSAILGVAFIVALAAPQRMSAQVLYGSIVGEVRDASGAAVPGATVTITNKETNQSREAKTDSAGSYNFIDVQTSTYTVKVTQQGFKTFERAGVRVALNSVMRVDVALEVGADRKSTRLNSSHVRISYAV